MNEPIDDSVSPWDEQLNAYLDDELDAAQLAALESAALENPERSRDLAAARQLKLSLAGMPLVPAPKHLSRKLLRVAGPAWAPFWLRRGAALACVALVVVVTNLGDADPSEAEIEQGRRDLALALSYLSKATQQTNQQINQRLSSAMLEPLTHTTVEILNQELELPKEYAL